MNTKLFAFTCILLCACLSTIKAQNVGIGEATPGSKFSIKGNLSVGSGYSTTAAPSNGAIIEGNVGIGNNNPSYKLDVTGTGRLTGALTIGAYTLPNTDGTSGYTLTTNGSGAVSWSRSGTAAIDAYAVGSGVQNAPNFTTTATTKTYTSGTIADLSTLTKTVSVTGVTNPILRVTLGLTINHNNVGDLTIKLTSPTGTVVTLSANNGGTGNNYTSTVFDDLGTSNITAGSAPFNGTYIPQQALSAFVGEAANGTWTLTITDGVSGTSGTLSSNATLTITTETAGAFVYVSEVAVPVVSGEATYVNAYYSALLAGTGLGVKVTRSTTSGSGSVGTVVAYSASESGSGSKYNGCSVAATNSGLASNTYFYKLWIAYHGSTGITTGTDNYNILVTKSH